jgi:hypothetical protein
MDKVQKKAKVLRIREVKRKHTEFGKAAYMMARKRDGIRKLKYVLRENYIRLIHLLNSIRFSPTTSEH